MSTKIYHGYRSPVMTLTELSEFSARLRENLQQKAKEIASGIMAELAVEIIDWITVSPDVAGLDKYVAPDNSHDVFSQNALSVAYRHCLERWKKKNRDPEIDLSFTVSILPVQRKICYIISTEQQEFRELWESMPEISEYEYYDNAARPEHISSRDWKQRKKDWEEALKYMGVPSMNGFTIDAVYAASPFYDVDRSKLGLFIPNFERRVDKIAVELAWEAYALDRHSHEKDYSDALYMRWLRGLKDTDHELIDAKRKEVRLHLIKDLTAADLNRPLHTFKERLV